MDRIRLHSLGDVVSLATQLVNIPSVSGDEEMIADAIESALRDCSWLEVTRFRNNVIARTRLGKSTRVIVAGHIDTVPAADNTESVFVQAGSPLPSSGELMTEDVLFGLGACDMKGGLAVAVHAACTVAEPAFDVTYVFYECEEVDSARNGLTLISVEHPEWLSADVAVLMEPSNAQIEAGCQGTLRAQIRATGVRAHSARSWLGSNAIHQLSGALTLLQNFEPARVMVDGLEYREGLNAVGIEGGVAGNVIPDVAILEVNYRYAPNKSALDAENVVRTLFADYEVTIVDNAPGALPGLDQQVLQDLVSRVGGEVAPKFGWTDVSRFSAMGVPAVNLGPGNPGLAHSRDEYVSVQQLHRSRDVLTAWLRG